MADFDNLKIGIRLQVNCEFYRTLCI